jgi:hypothetical protein
VDIPASMQTLVGERILRLGTSTERERFFFDIPAAQRNGNRTRYGYEVVDGRIVRSLNLENLLGRVVLEIFDGGPEGVDERKLVFRTNPTGEEDLYCILFLEVGAPTEEAAWLLETDVEYELEEDTEFWLLEESGGSEYLELEDVTIPKNIYPDVNSDDDFYVIQEDDFGEPE